MSSEISLTHHSDQSVWETIWINSSRLKDILQLIVERNKDDPWVIHWLENLPTTALADLNHFGSTAIPPADDFLGTDLKQIQEEDFMSLLEDEDDNKGDDTSKSGSSSSTTSFEQNEEKPDMNVMNDVQSKLSATSLTENALGISEELKYPHNPKRKERRAENSQLRIPQPPFVTLIFISLAHSKAFLIQVPKLFFPVVTLRTLRALQVNPSSNKIVHVGSSTEQWSLPTSHRLTRTSSIEESVNYFLQTAINDLYQVVYQAQNIFIVNPIFRKDATPSSSSSTQKNPSRLILVILLRSGRFAMALFNSNVLIDANKRNQRIQDTAIYHTTSSRYTTRRGQGGAQSTKDTQKSIKSVGSQLRRMGEVQLRQDIRSAFQEMYQVIKQPDIYPEDSSVVDLVSQLQFVFWGVSKTLLSSFWDDCNQGLGNKNFKSDAKGQEEFHHMFHAKNPKMKSIPIDYGRPSYQACCLIVERLMSCQIQDPIKEHWIYSLNLTQTNSSSDDSNKKNGTNEKTLGSNGADIYYTRNVVIAPLKPIHEAARDCDWKRLLQIIEHDSADLGDDGNCENETENEKHDSLGLISDVNSKAGPNLMTPLHYASYAISSTDNNLDPNDAAKCVTILLVQGGADPSIRDKYDCLPYSIASNDIIRIAFRRARGNLGDSATFDWDDAKVGPPITDESLHIKKQKAIDKKRRQRQSQKERKRVEQLKAEADERLKQEEMERQQKEEENRRVRAGLSAKTVTALSSNDSVCDYCQTVVKGKRRSQLYLRLDFAYCSMDCVKKHQRELTAAAALSRTSSNS